MHGVARHAGHAGPRRLPVHRRTGRVLGGVHHRRTPPPRAQETWAATAAGGSVQPLAAASPPSLVAVLENQ
jgi:hypothetical protein